MTMHDRQDDRIRREAAQWLARLGRPTDAQTLADFRAWLRDPDHRAAFARLEALWQDSHLLAGDPVIQALLRPLKKPHARPRLGHRLAALAAVAAALIAGLWLSAADNTPPTRHRTAAGEQRIVALEGGGQVRLNTDSLIEVSALDDGEQVRLEHGEALFDVPGHPTRRLIVLAGATRLEATNARFDVRRDHGRTVVMPVAGRVEVRAADTSKPPHTALTVGERLERDDNGMIRRAPGDPSRLLSWTRGRLEFQQTPLGEAIAEVNRYGGPTIILTTPALADTPVSGSFAAGRPRDFAAAVTRLFPLQADETPDGRILLRERPDAGAH